MAACQSTPPSPTRAGRRLTVKHNFFFLLLLPYLGEKATCVTWHKFGKGGGGKKLLLLFEEGVGGKEILSSFLLVRFSATGGEKNFLNRLVFPSSSPTHAHTTVGAHTRLWKERDRDARWAFWFFFFNLTIFPQKNLLPQVLQEKLACFALWLALKRLALSLTVATLAQGVGCSDDDDGIADGCSALAPHDTTAASLSLSLSLSLFSLGVSALPLQAGMHGGGTV